MSNPGDPYYPLPDSSRSQHPLTDDDLLVWWRSLKEQNRRMIIRVASTERYWQDFNHKMLSSVKPNGGVMINPTAQIDESQVDFQRGMQHYPGEAERPTPQPYWITTQDGTSTGPYFHYPPTSAAAPSAPTGMAGSHPLPPKEQNPVSPPSLPPPAPLRPPTAAVPAPKPVAAPAPRPTPGPAPSPAPRPAAPPPAPVMKAAPLPIRPPGPLNITQPAPKPAAIPAPPPVKSGPMKQY